VLRLPERMPDVIADASVLTRVVTALMADALRHSPAGRPPVLTARVQRNRLAVRVTDGAPDPGRPTTAARADSLALRFSRDLTEAMAATLTAAFTGPAFSVTLNLPTSARRTRPRRERRPRHRPASQ